MPRRDVSISQGETCLPYLSRRMGVCSTPMPRSLTALPCPGRQSGTRQAVAHCGRWLPETPRLLGLGVLMAILGVFTLAGCYLSRTINQATASDVNNRNFTFADGGVFNPALVNVSTALAFDSTAQNFTLCSAGTTATGTNRFGSCTLTVTDSKYGANAGPQINDVIKLDPCDFDSDNITLTVSNRGITVTSAAATTTTDTGCSTATPATANNVSNQSCTFVNGGGVFNSTLNNVSTTLAFPNNDNAQTFTLTSSGAVSGTASGPSSIVAGSCSLTVDKNNYASGFGPPVGTTIRLNPCTFNSSSNTLTVSNLLLTVTSAPCTAVP